MNKQTRLIGRQFHQVLISIDQVGNTLLGLVLIAFGRVTDRLYWADETMSAHAWRRQDNRIWAITRWLIDLLFWWQPDHCQVAYISESMREHIAEEYR